MIVKPDLPAPTPIRPNGQKAKPVGLAYDPSLVFVLELTTILVARDADTVTSLGKELASALQNVVRDSSHVHPVTLSRAVYYLLSFLRASHVSIDHGCKMNLTDKKKEHDFVRAPVVLHTISKFEPELLRQCAPYIAKGLSLCLNGPAGLRNEMVNTPDFWSVMHALHFIPETAKMVFQILESVAIGLPPCLTSDNYEAVVNLLNDFASAGNMAAQAERQQEETALRAKGAKPRQSAIEKDAKYDSRHLRT